MSVKLKILFEGHKGEQEKGDMKVKFYEMEFFNILEAIKMLKDVKPGKFYIIHYKKRTILVNEQECKYYYNCVWWPDWEELKNHIDTVFVNPLNIFESGKLWEGKTILSPIPSRLSKMDWLEIKEEEEEENEFASLHFQGEPWLFCNACKFGVCEAH